MRRRLDAFSFGAAIVGANGSGKSTLLKLIVGELEPQTGEVTRGRRLVLGYYDQHFSELRQCAPKASAVEFLVATHSCKTEEARKYLGKFGLDSARHVMPVRDHRAARRRESSSRRWR